MKALVLHGRFAGREFEIGQWCNDWFTLEPDDDMPQKEADAIVRMAFSPTNLAFDHSTWMTIKKHKNNGTLFKEFEKHDLNGYLGGYEYTFKRIKK